MIYPRLIPTLLIDNDVLVKGKQFKDHKYLGDPINAVKIFNDKSADELCLLNIGHDINNFNFINDIVCEAFMPVTFGGSVYSFEDVSKLFSIGIEKIVLSAALFDNPKLVDQISKTYGAQSVVASIDFRVTPFKKLAVYRANGKVKTSFFLKDFVHRCENLGVGELLIQDINNEGSFNGTNANAILQIRDSTSLPIIWGGGIGNLNHIKDTVNNGCDALSIGSFFLFKGKHDALMLDYPTRAQIKAIFDE